MSIYPRTLAIFCVCTLCAWILASGATAAAEPPPRKPPASEVTTYAFEDTAVLGDTVGAMGEVLQVRQRPDRESLIRARDSYVRELFKSVEAL